jgi:hypothetical protein
VSEQNETPQQTPPVAKPKITPTSMLSLGGIDVLVMKVETEDGSDFYAAPRRRVTKPGEDPSVIPVGQLPILIKLLEEITTPAISMRQFQPPTPPPPTNPVAATVMAKKTKSKKDKKK